MNTNLVTGGTGLLGSQLVLQLLLRGQAVRAGYRNVAHQTHTLETFRYYAPERAELLFKKIQWVPIDLHDPDSLDLALEGVHRVFHTAACVSFDSRDRNEMMQTNVEGTRQLVYACEGLPLASFVYFSSIAVLDPSETEGKRDEDSFYQAQLPHSDYAVSKHFSEMEVWRAQAEGLPALILNPGVILAAGFHQQSSGALIPSVIRQPFTFPGGTDYIDVRDVAEIALRLSDRGITGERFALTAENLSFKDLDHSIKTTAGYEPAPLVSQKMLSIAPYLSRVLGWAIPILRRADRAGVKAVSQNIPVNNSKLKNTLGDYTFYPIRQSLKDYTLYYIHSK